MKLAIELSKLIVDNVALTHHGFFDRTLTQSIISDRPIDLKRNSSIKLDLIGNLLLLLTTANKLPMTTNNRLLTTSTIRY